MEAFEILKRPILTEKSTAGNEKSLYTFEVAKNANKLQVKKAVEDAYGVTVEEVRTMRSNGKVKMRQTKSGVAIGRKGAIKKAMVQLAAGEMIDFFGNTEVAPETDLA
jgi:large subunit ribosomal protein L23